MTTGERGRAVDDCGQGGRYLQFLDGSWWLVGDDGWPVPMGDSDLVRDRYFTAPSVLPSPNTSGVDGAELS